MNKITLNTESYLIKGTEGERFFPFFELEYNEWVIYEDDFPKYYIELPMNSESNSSFREWLNNELKSGKKLKKVISSLGNQYGKNWNILPSQLGMEVEDGYKSEIMELEILNDDVMDQIKSSKE
ncbi:hypothetical protein U6A24_18310 [Aquimarina gracilis]|uniref:Uncharacterized protein n=1 Tax=Aquimarina gracilis TaxID=874422 RepID=A0ABU6A042_9FLAO|nr:hypothetical protein [Aquimarina gracilis]MEB3347435.1 hypothetical protein [Aquimarina gracilis]